MTKTSKPRKLSAKAPKRPSRLLLGTVQLLNKGKYKKHYGLKIDRGPLDTLKPPYIVLFNHIGDIDMYPVSMTLAPRLPNYMASRWLQHSFPNGWLARLAGTIFKDRFLPDAEAVLCAKRVLRERGGIVAIAPAASYSVDGTPNYFDHSIAKFVRTFHVPVVVVKQSGVYMLRNRFSPKAKKCAIKTEARLVYGEGELTPDTDLVEIFKTLYSACDFNDFEYQRQTRAKIVMKNPAEGMETVCYRCIYCGEEFQMRSEGNRLYCEACGNAVRVNEYYLFEPESQNTRWVDGIDKWNKIQRRVLLEEIKKPEFNVLASCVLRRYTKGKKYGFSDYGMGMLRLDATGFTYMGSDDGERVIRRYPIAELQNIGSAIDYISIDSHTDCHRFCLDDMRIATKMIQALNLMRLTRFEFFPGELEFVQNSAGKNVDDTVRVGFDGVN